MDIGAIGNGGANLVFALLVFNGVGYFSSGWSGGLDVLLKDS